MADTRYQANLTCEIGLKLCSKSSSKRICCMCLKYYTFKCTTFWCILTYIKSTKWSMFASRESNIDRLNNLPNKTKFIEWHFIIIRSTRYYFKVKWAYVIDVYIKTKYFSFQYITRIIYFKKEKKKKKKSYLFFGELLHLFRERHNQEKVNTETFLVYYCPKM